MLGGPMAKIYYCSVCGIHLVHSRRAVKDKGIILDLISPHECEGYAINSRPNGELTVKDILDKTSPERVVVKESDSLRPSPLGDIEPGDRRADKDKVSSTAPSSLIKAINHGDLY
jgi:hypothetical protein